MKISIYVIENERNINIYEIFQTLFITHAIQIKNLELIQYIEDNNLIVKSNANCIIKGLIDAFINNDFSLVRYMFENGANINIIDDSNKSALIYTCENIKWWNNKVFNR